ncbi:MAG TPA: response regulator [Vicinamibacteria bacterium]|nr:response regulator [Vicinamibacteria bacterium]
MTDPSRGDSPPRVLVAEDNPVAQKVAVAMLEGLGCAVDVVATGHAAVEAVRRTAYALVFMDCDMPALDGYEATRLIREAEAEAGRHTPILALSAHTMPTERKKSLAAGMDDHLVKPFRLDDLRGALARWTRGPAERAPGDPGAPPEARPAEIRGAGADLDLAQIAEYLAFPGLFGEVVERFVHRGAEALDAMEGAVRRGDAGSLAAAAHALRGGAGLVGARRLVALCRDIEERARTGEAELAAEVRRARAAHQEAARDLAAERDRMTVR